MEARTRRQNRSQSFVGVYVEYTRDKINFSHFNLLSLKLRSNFIVCSTCIELWGSRKVFHTISRYRGTIIVISKIQSIITVKTNGVEFIKHPVLPIAIVSESSRYDSPQTDPDNAYAPTPRPPCHPAASLTFPSVAGASSMN
jgi:hypothetical protein